MSKYKKQFISITEYLIQAWRDQDLKTISSYLQKRFGIINNSESIMYRNKEGEFEEIFSLPKDSSIGEYNVYQLENPDCNPDKWRTIADIEILDEDNDDLGILYVLFDWNENGKLNRMIIMNS